MSQGKLDIVKGEMKRTKTDILGISELKWTGKGYFRSEDFAVFYSGHDTLRLRGVALIVKKEIAQCVLGFNPVCDRILSMRIQGKPVNITVIQVYAPTTDAEEEEIKDFYDRLQDVLDASSQKDNLILMGDWNAKVGDGEERGITGRFGLGTRNLAGDRLLQFCEENSLVIANTCFKQHMRRLYTWTSPDGRFRNQIDYIICKKRWRSSVQSAKTYPGADCGTDHELLVARIRIRLKRSSKSIIPKRFDLEKIPDEFNVEVQNRFQALDLIDRDPDELWCDIKNIIFDVAKDKIPRISRNKKSKWLSDHALEIAESRRKAKVKGNLQRVRELNAEFQRQARKDKEIFLNKECRQIEEDNRKGKSRDLFKKIREITGKFTPRLGVLKDKSGKEIIEETEIKSRWKEYTEDLYRRDSSMTDTFQYIEFTEEPLVTESEVRRAVKELANGKAPGIDGIPIELFKTAGDDAIKVLTAVCKSIWKNVTWPKDWKRSVYIPIPKKGDSRECANYRTIALISQASKVLLKVLQKRLEPYMEREMPVEQAGFRKGRGTRDQISNLRWIMEKAREFQKDIYLCFIDYSKAFDCVDHDRLWNVLRTMGIPEHLILLMKGIYSNQEATVRTVGGDTDWFNIGKGVRQGCILSPYLFNLYSENILRMAGLEEEEAGVRIGGYKINNLRYADDTTVLAENEEDLLRLILKVQKESLKSGLRLNIKKTKIMTTGKLKGIKINNEQIEEVKSFVFLGSRVDRDGGSAEDVRRRLMMGRSAMAGLHKIMKDKDISVATKKRLVKVMVFPVAMYGCESWTLRKSERKRIDSFELWCWRRLLRVSWTEKRSNKYILNKVLPECSLEALMMKRKLTYFGHVMRADNSMEKAIMLGKIEGKRKRGRQRTRWMDNIKEVTGMSLEQLKNATVQRAGWRAFVHGVTRSRNRLDGT